MLWNLVAPLASCFNKLPRHTSHFGRPLATMSHALVVGQSHIPIVGLFQSIPQTFVGLFLGQDLKWCNKPIYLHVLFEWIIIDSLVFPIKYIPREIWIPKGLQPPKDPSVWRCFKVVPSFVPYNSQLKTPIDMIFSILESIMVNFVLITTFILWLWVSIGWRRHQYLGSLVQH